jgi:Xaa-Pro aminopeptidase
LKIADMFNKEVYIQRRKLLCDFVGSGVLLFLGNEESSMSYKANCYHFRQDSSFLYFFGLDRPGLAAMIDIDESRETIFGDELTEEDVVWTGPKESLLNEALMVGVHHLKPSLTLAGDIHNFRKHHRQIHYLPPYRPENITKIHELLDIPFPSIALIASVPFIKGVVAQRSIKSAEEIVEIEKGVNLTAAMQLLAMQNAFTGQTEAELAGQLHGLVISSGVQLAFPTILTVQGDILHNHYSTNRFKEGQLVLCDCGAESPMRYAGDLTRTFPVNKTFTTEQKEIAQIVLDAFEHGVSLLKPGVFYRDIHLSVCRYMVNGLKQLGLMKGDPDEAVAAGAHTLLFPCGLGHMLGLDTHDMEDLGEKYVGYTEELEQSKEFGLKSLRLGRQLEEGFVITVEPGLYFNPYLMDSWQAQHKYLDFVNYDKLQRYKGFGGVRIEEDFLITQTGSKKLGVELPKTIADIEDTRRQLKF